MRGKVHLPSITGSISRITPAHAGKRKNLTKIVLVLRDHPRTCGEKVLECITLFHTVRSPPHMRGKGMYEILKQYEYRITPAHAGKRTPFIRKGKNNRDHPRTCGEKEWCLCMSDYYSGSPPHMRGKDEENILFHLSKGITPAHAGKSFEV